MTYTKLHGVSTIVYVITKIKGQELYLPLIIKTRDSELNALDEINFL